MQPPLTDVNGQTDAGGHVRCWPALGTCVTLHKIPEKRPQRRNRTGTLELGPVLRYEIGMEVACMA